MGGLHHIHDLWVGFHPQPASFRALNIYELALAESQLGLNVFVVYAEKRAILPAWSRHGKVLDGVAVAAELAVLACGGSGLQQLVVEKILSGEAGCTWKETVAPACDEIVGIAFGEDNGVRALWCDGLEF